MGYHYEPNVNDYIYDWDTFEAGTGVRRYSLKDEDELSIETENSQMSEQKQHPKNPPSVDSKPLRAARSLVKPELKALTVAVDHNNQDDCSHQDEKNDTVGELSDIRMQTQVHLLRVVIDHRNMTEIGHAFFRLYSRGRRLNMVIKTLKKTSKSVRRYMKSWGLKKIFKNFFLDSTQI